ncbi:hypothetical protein DOK78_001215 [Enterococcus sp. DIV2402]|uniref:PTS EIIA type-4 domain-containing protein n=1 Tax=Candidatus Enterococcus lowellii TaxID=2230877 RepID=A0ABZ2SM39_9ENTE|nr:hypothetical protein [Enterococcus sp. DIV2402]MBO0464586.1 hypothetical protein [Enterococcus sp. DIV2402]
MYKIIIASHGPLADGMKESLKFFFSTKLEVTTVSIDNDGLVSFQEKMDRVFDEVATSEVLIFTDLLYGTPFNEAGKRAANLSQYFDIISSVNMPILVEAVNLQRQNIALEDAVPQLLEVGQVQSFRNKMQESSVTDDE